MGNRCWSHGKDQETEAQRNKYLPVAASSTSSEAVGPRSSLTRVCPPFSYTNHGRNLIRSADIRHQESVFGPKKLTGPASGKCQSFLSPMSQAQEIIAREKLATMAH